MNIVAATWSQWLLALVFPSGLWIAILLAKSLKDFSRTGPHLRDEVRGHHAAYAAYAITRLCFWGGVLTLFLAGSGEVVYASLLYVFRWDYSLWQAMTAAAIGIGSLTAVQFCRHLLHLPAGLEASSNYRLSRFYPLWRWLKPSRLRGIQAGLCLAFAASVASAVLAAISRDDFSSAALYASLAVIYLAVAIYSWYRPRLVPAEIKSAANKSSRPNIIMIGSDTLRADRLGVDGNKRGLTPFIDNLARRGTYFRQCYVPCARTAPSIVSMLTGSWPFNHRIRENFAAPGELKKDISKLPDLLRGAGYRTYAISDWAGGDLGKFSFGFENRELPDDQWNIKYLIRQGPKDLRLYLSLFTHGIFGKCLLPELYYLAGVPMTSELGQSARATISRNAKSDTPFLLDVFMSTTHGPFGSEYPYYTLFSGDEYAGSCKFVMGGLSDPFEIVERQKEGRGSFDLAQILNLYDGCVRNFDDEVARIYAHLEKCGLAENTILVIYSDHGMEFFESDTWGQGNSVIVDVSARIPLIVADPRQKIKGKVVDDVVRSIDLAPTLLELCGIDVPSDMDGVTLAPYLRDAEAKMNLTAYAETGVWFAKLPGISDHHLLYPELPDLLEVPDKKVGTIAIKKEFRQRVIEAKDRMIRNDRWKLVRLPMREGPEFRLFDIQSDPDCRHNVIETFPDVAAALKAEFGHFFTD
ncbi:sulfatase [Methylococcus sp. EFPC2]|uniref:sulfatase family protein n=1 Tax=Methylococcus sp. EFPC2 TaxID=2812648 RepID=UPI00196897B1|nr:sulfatase [Methylococcus sp. EFPC2]QSA98437.1 sulfatase [Methylococcus sp. EFPC2]